MAKNKAQVEDTEAGDDEGADQIEVEGAGEKKAGYETMLIGVGKSRKPLRDQLETLAAKLNVKASAVVWEAIKQIVANPPSKIDAPTGQGSQGPVGSAPGFWVVPITNKAGRATDIKVYEVEKRSDLSNGRTFIRFKAGDVKERGRAERQALKAAQYDARMIGVNPETIKVEKAPAA